MAELWGEHAPYHAPVELVDFVPQAGSALFVQGALAEGWVLRLEPQTNGAAEKRLHLLTDAEIFGWSRPEPRQRTLRRTAAAAPESAFEEFQPGDLVVYCPDQLGPAVSRLLTGVPVREFTFPRFDNPDLINWVDYRQRIDNTNIEEFAQTLVKKSKGKNIFLVDSSAYNYVFGRCSALGAELAKSASAELKQVPSAKVLEGQGVTVFRSL